MNSGFSSSPDLFLFQEKPDLLDEGIDNVLLSDLADYGSSSKKETDVFPPGYTHVGVSGLTRAVNGTAHDGDPHNVLDAPYPFLYLCRDSLNVYFASAAGRATCHGRTDLSQAKTFQDIQGNLDLPHGIGRKRNPHRVANAF